VYKYVLNYVVKISMMFAKYFEHYTIILREAVFSWTRCICNGFSTLLPSTMHCAATAVIAEIHVLH